MRDANTSSVWVGAQVSQPWEVDSVVVMLNTIQARKNEEERLRQVRATALSKLTDEERQALGV